MNKATLEELGLGRGLEPSLAYYNILQTEGMVLT